MTVQKQDHPSIKVVIPGVSGVGKSTLFEKLIRREKARWIFLYDHKQGDLARRFDEKSCYDLDELCEATSRGGYVIFNPAKMYAGKPEDGFGFFADFVWNVSQSLKGKKIFGSDELDNLCDVSTPPDELLCILDQGRTFQIDCFFICQAMNALHNRVRKQMTEIFAFRQGDERGVQWLADKGMLPEKLTALKNGEWIYKNLNTGEEKNGGKAFEPKNAGRNLNGL
jgi:hypothetical protein